MIVHATSKVRLTLNVAQWGQKNSELIFTDILKIPNEILIFNLILLNTEAHVITGKPIIVQFLCIHGTVLCY